MRPHQVVENTYSSRTARVYNSPLPVLSVYPSQTATMSTLTQKTTEPKSAATAVDTMKIAANNAPLEQLDVGVDEKIALRQADSALAFLRNQEPGHTSNINEKQLLRKIDYLIMPILFGVCKLAHSGSILIGASG